MKLRVLLPTEIFLEVSVTKVIAESPNGSFCLLPRHIDFVTALVPGILSFETGGAEQFVAVDEGLLVKCGAEVLVSVRRAMIGPGLGTLRRAIADEFQRLDDRERRTRSALAKLEANLIRRFIQL